MPLAPQFRRTPVSSGSGPVLVPFPRWQKACDRVSAALLGGETRVIVTGPPGTGKTLLLDQTARVLRAAGWTVMLRLADAGPPPSQHGSVAILIDEADRLSREALQQLLAATSAPVVLAGLDVLQSRVAGATQVALSPLAREEARDYIAHWLALTGRSPANLEAAAMRRTVEISGGVPRLASTLLGAATWLAESADETVITVQHVEEAAALRSCFVPGDPDVGVQPEPAPKRTRAPVFLAVLACMLLLGAGAYVATRYYTAETAHAVRLVRDAAAQLQAAITEKLGGSAETKTPSPAPAPLAQAPAAPPAPPKPQAPAPAAPAPAAIVSAAPPEPAAAKPSRPIALPATPAISETPAPAPPSAVAVAEPPAPPPAAIEPPSAPPVVQPAPIVDTPAPPGPAPAPAPAIVASAPPLDRPRTLPPETISLLVRRGTEMMVIGDVSAARALFGRAAEAGDADAMLAMGRTFDPATLAQASPLFTPDPTEATRWYRRAAEAGNKTAEDLLRKQRRGAID